jgi:hypothetical protein
MMLRLMQLRFSATVLLVVAVVSLTAASAWAFTQEFVQPGGNGNSTFTDPDDQLTNPSQGARPFGPSGPVVQFGIQQGPVTSFDHFQGNGFNASPSDSLPDPYFRPLSGH